MKYTKKILGMVVLLSSTPALTAGLSAPMSLDGTAVLPKGIRNLRYTGVMIKGEEKFDKKDKKMLKTWNVVVRKKEKTVNIYCPSCWNMAIQAVKEGFEAGKAELKYEEENNNG